tara:strand:+ start:8941 stop:10299 length:1359 start_codon:yes stop_codon:yes gene_type:complete
MKKKLNSNDLISGYTASLDYDKRLYEWDILGSIAHTKMLSKQDIISSNDAEMIIKGLGEIKDEIESNTFPWVIDLEDIHMNIERRLSDKIGEVAGKLHTGRSRNDQIALDMRLFVRSAVNDIDEALLNFQKVLVTKADENKNVYMPGYTHLQRAQPVLFAHHFLAYFEMIKRDRNRFKNVYSNADVLPLGSGALAGVPYNTDRNFLAKELGFSKISENSMDAVSDRDFIVDFHAAVSICMIHFSRLSEEIVLWCSEEFKFLSLDPNYSTGSSIMPQKSNPDFAELARGRTGRVTGNLMSILMILKALPLTYNRDLQEDKQGTFDSFDVMVSTIKVISELISTSKVNVDRMQSFAIDGNALATDIADYLVKKGLPFREAHGIVAKLSLHAKDSGIHIQELPLAVFKKYSNLFGDDVSEITVESSINSRNTIGGTSIEQVTLAIDQAKEFLDEM